VATTAEDPVAQVAVGPTRTDGPQAKEAHEDMFRLKTRGAMILPTMAGSSTNAHTLTVAV
jgi:hypothetical protein